MSADSKKPYYKPKTLGQHDRARDSYKQNLWNNRLVLLRRGQLLVKNDLYGEAVVVYEKYLRILEIIYECSRDGLTPKMFKETGRTSELSVIAGVYWDLIRIYDTNKKYLPRQKVVAEKLALFAPFTPLFLDLMKKAKSFQKQARNPDVIKSLIAAAGHKKGRCFIATAAFVSTDAPEVQQLRHFRDHRLRNTYWGRQFIYYYYQYSPQIACFIDKHSFLKTPIQKVLRAVIKCVT